LHVHCGVDPDEKMTVEVLWIAGNGCVWRRRGGVTLRRLCAVKRRVLENGAGGCCVFVEKQVLHPVVGAVGVMVAKCVENVATKTGCVYCGNVPRTCKPSFGVGSGERNRVVVLVGECEGRGCTVWDGGRGGCVVVARWPFSEPTVVLRQQSQNAMFQLRRQSPRWTRRWR
jgi:hypothetical protein